MEITSVSICILTIAFPR